jgi:hypothetical protein
VAITDDQIKHMVNRFLQWRLPANFAPDNGVSFKQVIYDGMSPENQAAHWPVGTNLLDATQAEAMVRHMVEGLSAPPSVVTAARELLEACLADFGEPDDWPDNEAVSSGDGGDSAVKFGMLRNLHTALSALPPASSSAVQAADASQDGEKAGHKAFETWCAYLVRNRASADMRDAFLAGRRSTQDPA